MLNFIQQVANNKLEQKKLKSTMILKALDAGDTSKISKTLLWFVKNKMIEDEDSLITKAANNAKELPTLLGFNLNLSDLPTVLVANGTTNPCASGVGISCWKPSVVAHSGDIISVQIFFHNTGNTIASNVAVALRPKYSEKSTVHVFSGAVAVGDNIVAHGSATVNTIDNQALIFIPGSLRFYPNQSDSAFRMEGEENLFSNYGLNIGDVQPTNFNQGNIVVSFKVGNY